MISFDLQNWFSVQLFEDGNWKTVAYAKEEQSAHMFAYAAKNHPDYKDIEIRVMWINMPMSLHFQTPGITWIL
jgi:hypothetical protein